MSLSEEYSALMRKQIKEENDLAQKYAKYKIGTQFIINGYLYKVVEIFPEEGTFQAIVIKYILSSPDGYGEKWINEEDLNNFERV